MLHTPIPDRVALVDEKRFPPAAGILLAMGGSILLWGAIYAGCVFAF
jgi:hypothetical protein